MCQTLRYLYFHNIIVLAFLDCLILPSLTFIFRRFGDMQNEIACPPIRSLWFQVAISGACVRTSIDTEFFSFPNFNFSVFLFSFFLSFFLSFFSFFLSFFLFFLSFYLLPSIYLFIIFLFLRIFLHLSFIFFY